MVQKVEGGGLSGFGVEGGKTEFCENQGRQSRFFFFFFLLGLTGPCCDRAIVA
jgi:hypothetical protein